MYANDSIEKFIDIHAPTITQRCLICQTLRPRLQIIKLFRFIASFYHLLLKLLRPLSTFFREFLKLWEIRTTADYILSRTLNLIQLNLPHELRKTINKSFTCLILVLANQWLSFGEIVAHGDDGAWFLFVCGGHRCCWWWLIKWWPFNTIDPWKRCDVISNPDTDPSP